MRINQTRIERRMQRKRIIIIMLQRTVDRGKADCES